MKSQRGILAKHPQKKLDRMLRIPILRGIVKNKIKTLLGLNNARICSSVAAPIPPAVLEGFARLGIDITEGFDMAVVVMAAQIGNAISLSAETTGLAETLKKANDRLEAHERRSHIVVAKDPWTIENALLTPTLKIKSELVEKKYADLIAKPKTGSVVFETGQA